MASSDILTAALLGQLQQVGNRRDSRRELGARLIAGGPPPAPIMNIGSGLAYALTRGLDAYSGAQMQRDADQDETARRDGILERLTGIQREQREEADRIFPGFGAPPAQPMAPPTMAPQPMPTMAPQPMPMRQAEPAQPEMPPMAGGDYRARNAEAARLRDAVLDDATITPDEQAQRLAAISARLSGATGVPAIPGGYRANPGVEGAFAGLPAPSGVVPPIPQQAPRLGVDFAAIQRAFESGNPIAERRARAALQVAQAQRGEEGRPVTVAPGGALVDPRTGRVILERPPAEQAPLAPERFQQELQRAAAGRPSVEVRTGQTFGEALGRNTAEALQNLQNDARTANDTLQSVGRIRSLLDQGAITGTLAESRLAFERALSGIGLLDGRRVTNTEQLMSELANNVLAKSSQMAGVLTDRDIQFLREASAGTVNLTADTIRQVTQLAERAASRQIERYNRAVEPLQNSPDVPEVSRRIYAPIGQQPAAGGRVRVTSPAEAERLAPGTEYETPNGQVFRR